MLLGRGTSGGMVWAVVPEQEDPQVPQISGVAGCAALVCRKRMGIAMDAGETPCWAGGVVQGVGQK